MNINKLEQLIVQWFKDRQIIPNSSPEAQSIKTLEEVSEMIDALYREDKDDLRDAIGDIIVTLIGVAHLSGMDLTECLSAAYDEIKDRIGYLNEQGIFIKEETK